MAARPLTLDELKTASLAFRELLRQMAEAPPPADDQDALDTLTGGRAGPATFDLIPIWRAAMADEGVHFTTGQLRMRSPRRFVKRPLSEAAGWEERDGGIFVDEDSAMDYLQEIDLRIGSALFMQMERKRAEAIADDPIMAGLDACRGGPFGWMFNAPGAARAAGLDLDEFALAVLDRARSIAAGYDDEYKAEALLAQVRKAIESAPKIVPVYLDRDS